MELDPNEQYIKEAIKNADLPQAPDWDRINETLKAKAKAPIQHSWRQQGPSLVCSSCPHEHSQWVGMDKRLTGFDNEGRPILEDITM